MTELLAPSHARSRMAGAVPWIGLALAAVLIVAATVYPMLAGLNVYVQDFPPLLASWLPRVGPGTIPAIALAILAARYAIDLAARVRWRVLLIGSFASSLIWMLSLAAVDGVAGVAGPLDTQYEYLRTARAVTDFGAVLHEYVTRIPEGAVDSWPVHIAGHPPGALLFFVVLVRLGLGSGLAAGLVVAVIAATTPAAVLITMRRLGAEAGARRAVPFFTLGPAAIWMAVSADAMFEAFAAWGLCVLACAATSSGRARVAGYAVAAGLLLGYCVMLSYGLPLLGVLAVAVLVLARRWTPLPWAVGGAAAVVIAFAVGGFAWWQAYPALVSRYWEGVASQRPTGYWIWANFAAVAMSAGPLFGAGLAVAVSRVRSIRSAPRADVVVIALALSALLSLVLADASLMSKAEVERIWLPFVPWLLLGTALLPEKWRRWGFAGQLAFALVVQHALLTLW
ncbi:hypothetical protein [uncultured Microbacterium sp.]|uniref:hypothetical protein n=1 Tax=uncultured Microbacterium sp. TaxID=191216 RepID=UPI0035CAA3D0